MRYYEISILLIFYFLLASCIKQPLEPQKPNIVIDTTYEAIGVYVLNEGLFNMNNSTLTYYNFADNRSVTDYFEIKNNRKIGDTGNDIAIYGDKMYIVVNVSSQIEVLNAYTGKIIKQIALFDGNKPRQPRYIAFNSGKVFVCSFEGTVAVIDTTTLSIEKIITVGRNPDGIAITNNKLYVSNSGGLDFPNYDSTVSVVDLFTLEEIKRIPVRINPYTIVPDTYGDLYIVSRGNYGDVKMCLQVIDSKTDKVKYTFPNLEVLNLTIEGDTAYAYFYDYSSGSNYKIILIDVRTETIITENFITDGTTLTTPYGIAVNKVTKEVFVADAKGFTNTGEVYCFGSNGKKRYSFRTGLNPGHFAFLYKRKIDAMTQ